MTNHETALSAAKNLLKYESILIEVLGKMRDANEFIALGYRHLFEYVVVALNLSESQASYYQRIIQKSVEVPKLAEAIVKGELSVSEARRIVPVVTQENCADWVDKASRLKQRELEKAVAEVNPNARVREGAKPVGPKLIQLTVALTPEVEALLQQVKDLESQRTKSNASWNDVLKNSCEAYLESNDPIRKAKRASSRKPRPQKTPKPGRQAFASKVRHEVNLRDQFQCTGRNPDGTRCTEKRWLEYDHIIPVHQGGVNTADNLRTLCNAHHRLRHQRVAA